MGWESPPMRTSVLLFLTVVSLALHASAQGKIWAYPYLQNVTPTSADLYWVSEDPRPLVLRLENQSVASQAVRAEALRFHSSEVERHPELAVSAPRFLHKVALRDLEPGREYRYQVDLSRGDEPFHSRFRTLPVGRQSFRFVAYSDSETEPESQGARVTWASPAEPGRRYLVDQTVGYRANLEAILASRPLAVVIAGDLVESGGEQRDWDEFWRMNTGPDGEHSLASQVPILPALGNHDYYGGPHGDKYALHAIMESSRRFFTYFHPTGSAEPQPYYSVALGPARLIVLDSCDGTPHETEADPNFHLHAAPREVAGIQADSRQTRWLEKELAESQKQDAFTFVVFHHCPYSSGPHGLPPGRGPGRDPQSGHPLRAWTPLFLKYGVDAVLTGHDEIWERSVVEGHEWIPGRGQVPHQIHFYDVGVGGDGLRAVQPGAENPFQRFLAERDAPERWENGVLVEGGRHYGHLEVTIEPEGEHGWTAVLEPVYLLPQRQADESWRFERRLYPDRVTLRAR